MRWFFLKIIAFVSLFCFLFTLDLAFAVTDSVNVFLDVNSSCGNGICEPGYGESFITCLIDCLCDNDGVCEPEHGENYQNCPHDCYSTRKIGGGKVDIAAPVIFNIVVRDITSESADVFWETDEPAVCQFFWGRTYEYKEESITEESFSQKHSLGLVGLSPDTVYHFKIACQDKRENKEETKDNYFSTLTPPDEIPPPNISDFEAIAGDKELELRWQNPPVSDFEGVKIMRSTNFYPSHPWEGELVYEGKGASFIDKGLENRVRYYYTAFSYDKANNFSSGAIASGIPQAPGVPPVYPPPPIKPPVEKPPPEIEKIKITDFDFIQEKEKLLLIEKKAIKVKAEKPLEISIDYQKTPEVLKTIMVTLEKDDKFFSFLLRINKAKTAYRAVLLPPSEAGIYPLTITILDYKNQALKNIKGFFIVERGETPLEKKKDLRGLRWLICLLLLIFLVLLTRYIYKKCNGRYKNKKT